MSQSTVPVRLTDRKRAAIIEAAITEFRQSGFDLTSMDRIAASAGVSKRTVYNHFPSKEELFAQILHQLLDRSVEGAELAYRPGRPLRDQLLQLATQKLRLMQDENFVALARVAVSAGIHSPERAHNVFSRISAREEGITTWVRAAAADGRLSTPDPAFAAMQLQAVLKGFAFWPQVAMGQPVLSAAQQTQLAEQSVDMFLSQYGRD